MSIVSLLEVKVLNNPARFTDKYEFEITFECLEQLEKGRRCCNARLCGLGGLPTTDTIIALPRSRMEAHLCGFGHIVSVSHPPPGFTVSWPAAFSHRHYSDQYDQELDTLLVGPIPVGVNKFIFEADPPDMKRIPDAEILGVTVILLTCAYDDREFVRVGYYVNNEYDSDELNADPPAKPLVDHIRRNVLAEKPRVTRFGIKWCVLCSLSLSSSPVPSVPSVPSVRTHVH